MSDLIVLRVSVVAAATAIFAAAPPAGLTTLQSAAAGALAGILIVTIETRLRRVSLKRLIGSATGLVVAVGVAALVAVGLGAAAGSEALGMVSLGVLLLAAYVGVSVGAAKGDLINLNAIDLFRADDEPSEIRKLLDTSVIIDGRVADIAATGFLDGPLVVPQFVLWELQLVADSSDGVKRNRGRRGLDILQKLQKGTAVDVEIIDTDYPHLKEVDQKLIELAKDISAKIVTNDYNLNKLARLHDVPVLNINELANAVKPVVLPGETMQVLILKEGKEHNQGVAYLDDGTMVVVDNARRQISKTIEIVVTSVLQTTAGKMIFGRHEQVDDDPEPIERKRGGARTTGQRFGSN